MTLLVIITLLSPLMNRVLAGKRLGTVFLDIPWLSILPFDFSASLCIWGIWTLSVKCHYLGAVGGRLEGQPFLGRHPLRLGSYLFSTWQGSLSFPSWTEISHRTAAYTLSGHVSHTWQLYLRINYIYHHLVTACGMPYTLCEYFGLQDSVYFFVVCNNLALYWLLCSTMY